MSGPMKPDLTGPRSIQRSGAKHRKPEGTGNLSLTNIDGDEGGARVKESARGFNVNRLEIAGAVRAGQDTFHSAGEQSEGASQFTTGDSRRDEVDGIVEQALAQVRIGFDQGALERRTSEIQLSAIPRRKPAGMTSAEVGSGATRRAAGRP